MIKQYQAYSADYRVTRDTPRKAALAFFENFPAKRKCSIIEGVANGASFTVTYGRASEGDWPMWFKDITKKMAATLPDDKPQGRKA